VVGVIAVVGIIGMIMSFKSHEPAIAAFFAFAFLAPSLLASGMQIADIIRVTVAPRLYVIEYLGDLVK